MQNSVDVNSFKESAKNWRVRKDAWQLNKLLAFLFKIVGNLTESAKNWRVRKDA